MKRERSRRKKRGERERPIVFILILKLYLDHAQEREAAGNMQREEVKSGVLSS